MPHAMMQGCATSVRERGAASEGASAFVERSELDEDAARRFVCRRARGREEKGSALAGRTLTLVRVAAVATAAVEPRATGVARRSAGHGQQRPAAVSYGRPPLVDALWCGARPITASNGPPQSWPTDLVDELGAALGRGALRGAVAAVLPSSSRGWGGEGGGGGSGDGGGGA